MARRCTVCDHKARMAIDRDLMGGEANTRIAARYGLKEQSVRRHKELHLHPKVAKAMAKMSAKEGWTYAVHVKEALHTALSILDGSDDPDQKLRALDRVLKACDTGGRFSGEIMSANVAAFLSELGVGGEQEIKRIVAHHKELDGLTLEGHRSDLIEATRLYLSEHPQDAAHLRAEMFGETLIEEG
jgi:hypothetical protein